MSDSNGEDRSEFMDSITGTVLAVVVFVAVIWLVGFGVLGLDSRIDLGLDDDEVSFDVPGDNVELREHTRHGLVIFEVTAVDEDNHSINVTTNKGGGTGILLNGSIEEGDLVILEPARDPEWQQEGVGEYAASGDEITFITRANHETQSPYGLYTYNTTSRTSNPIPTE